MLEVACSKKRTERLTRLLNERRLDAAVCAAPAHVYYFSAFLPRWVHQAAVVVFADGRSCLIRTHRDQSPAAADEVIGYEADWIYTLRQEQPQTVATQVINLMNARKARRIGFDASPVATHVAAEFSGEKDSLEPHLWQIRRRKDPDELRLLSKALRCCEAMYRRAREIVEPGVPELHVFSELHAAAVTEAGEPLTALLGNDFACGEMGGPPRPDRRAKEGEIYILDVGPAYRGYFADTSRAFAVNRRPTDAQMRAWHAIIDALKLVETTARPGVRCRELFAAVQNHFRQTCDAPMTHHLGHGCGLQPHEFPHLSPHWDDVLQEGEVFTAEPGLYSTELTGGIRLENAYLVTTDGVKCLLNSPLELA